MELLKTNVDNNPSFPQVIYKNDVLKISPTTGSITNINKTGDVQFQSLQNTNPLDICNAKFYYKIEIETKDAAKITLENNWFPNLFTSMRLKLGSSTVEQITDPGTISTMLNLVMIPEGKINQYKSYGWFPACDDIYDKNIGRTSRTNLYKAKKYEGYFPLNLLFGFLQNYNRLLFNVFIEVIVNKQDEPKELFFGDAATEAKLKIITLELHIPEWTLNPKMELDLLERYSLNRAIKVTFLDRNCGNYSMDTGTNFSIKLGNLAYKPKYIIIGIKDPELSFQKNNNLFILNNTTKIAEIKDDKGAITRAAKTINYYLKSIQIQLNNVYYPINRMEFNPQENEVILPYQAYIYVCQEFFSDPQLDILEWVKYYPIFCMNVSAQDPKLSINNVDVTLHRTKDSNFKGKLYWVILEEEQVELKLAGNKIVLVENVKGLSI